MEICERCGSKMSPVRGVGCNAIHYLCENVKCDSEYCTLYNEWEYRGKDVESRRIKKTEVYLSSASKTKKVKACWGCGFDYLNNSKVSELTEVGKNFYCISCLKGLNGTSKGKKAKSKNKNGDRPMDTRKFQKLMRDTRSDMINDGHGGDGAEYDVARCILFMNTELRDYLRRRYPELKSERQQVNFIAESIA